MPIKTVLIIGDSFGVPNYNGPPGIPPENHVEFLLRDMKSGGSAKYDVINLSMNGSPNDVHVSQLNLWSFNRPLKSIDFIVWFHNAAINFLQPPNQTFTVDAHMHDYLTNTYVSMQQVKRKFQAKWAVIGGSGPVPEFFDQYCIHDYLIRDWRARILEQNLPPVFATGLSTSSSIVTSELNLDSKDTQKRIIGDLDRIQQLISANKILFPDGVHPGTQPHLQLAQELDTWFDLVPPKGIEPLSPGS